MIHYGKTINGDLQIIVNEESIKEMLNIILSAPLMERRTFYGLKRYIEDNYKEILINHKKSNDNENKNSNMV